MTNNFEDLSSGAKWRFMVTAAKLGAEQVGYTLKRLPGRGMSNIWNLTKGSQTKIASMRTTQDRYIAYPPLDNGQRWKTLDDVELVLVAAVDDKEDPHKVEVYLFDADEVRQRFRQSYAARVDAGQSVKNNFGMWLNLDNDQRGVPASEGSGLAEKQKPIAVFSIDDLIEEALASRASVFEPEPDGEQELAESNVAASKAEPPLTIAEAKRRLAQTLGVDPSCIKISVEA